MPLQRTRGQQEQYLQPELEAAQLASTAWLNNTSGLEGARLPILVQRLNTHTYRPSRVNTPMEASMTKASYITPVTVEMAAAGKSSVRSNDPFGRRRATMGTGVQSLAIPHSMDPYRRNHPGARRSSMSKSVSPAFDKGTLTRRMMLPNGEWLSFADGIADQLLDAPATGVFRATRATMRPDVTYTSSANPNPTFVDREQWQTAVTNRLAGTSLREDAKGTIWPGTNEAVSGLGHLTEYCEMRCDRWPASDARC